MSWLTLAAVCVLVASAQAADSLHEEDVQGMVSMHAVQESRLAGRWTMVEHSFALGEMPASPFTHPVWVVVERPAAAKGPVSRVAIPAFYDGDGTWRIRYRPDRPGLHHVAAYLVGDEAATAVEVAAAPHEERAFHVEGDPEPGFVRVSPDSIQRFEFDNGDAFYPIGYNVAWESSAGYREHFQRMKETGLNWSRVWMAHWAGMNLDWVMGREIPHGELDLEVARRWDEVVEAAQESGIRFQLVLQHHGQVSTWVNSNWRENPWNRANGGWLDSPAQFFTDEKARDLTKAKYRYIVARWGHSPAIMAWELFNEVELTDGYVERGLREIWELADRHGNFAPRLDTGMPAVRDDADVDVAQAELGVLGKLAETWNVMGGAVVKSLGPGAGHRQVARWHSEMAAHIRTLDPTGRLITTSSAPRESLIWQSMDYYQLHMYHREMIIPLARIPGGIGSYDKPVFVGEMGHHEILDPLKEDGRYMAPMLWAGLFAGAAGAAQMWAWDIVEEQGLLRDFGAMTRFIDAARLAQLDYEPVDVRIQSAASEPALMVLGMIASESLVLWMFDPDSMANQPARSVSATITLPDVVHGVSCEVNWFDTRTGEIVVGDLLAPGHAGVLDSPLFSGHLAAIITPMAGTTFRRSQ